MSAPVDPVTFRAEQELLSKNRHADHPETHCEHGNLLSSNCPRCRIRYDRIASTGENPDLPEGYAEELKKLPRRCPHGFTQAEGDAQCMDCRVEGLADRIQQIESGVAFTPKPLFASLESAVGRHAERMNLFADQITTVEAHCAQLNASVGEQAVHFGNRAQAIEDGVKDTLTKMERVLESMPDDTPTPRGGLPPQIRHRMTPQYGGRSVLHRLVSMTRDIADEAAKNKSGTGITSLDAICNMALSMENMMLEALQWEAQIELERR